MTQRLLSVPTHLSVYIAVLVPAAQGGFTVKLKKVQLHCQSLPRAPSKTGGAEKDISERSVIKNKFREERLNFLSFLSIESDVTDRCDVKRRSKFKQPKNLGKKNIIELCVSGTQVIMCIRQLSNCVCQAVK